MSPLQGHKNREVFIKTGYEEQILWSLGNAKYLNTYEPDSFEASIKFKEKSLIVMKVMTFSVSTQGNIIKNILCVQQGNLHSYIKNSNILCVLNQSFHFIEFTQFSSMTTKGFDWSIIELVRFGCIACGLWWGWWRRRWWWARGCWYWRLATNQQILTTCGWRRRIRIWWWC